MQAAMSGAASSPATATMGRSGATSSSSDRKLEPVAVAQRDIQQREIIGAGIEAPPRRREAVCALDLDWAGIRPLQGLADLTDELGIERNQQDAQ
jgi:hypothetical protein